MCTCTCLPNRAGASKVDPVDIVEELRMGIGESSSRCAEIAGGAQRPQLQGADERVAAAFHSDEAHTDARLGGLEHGLRPVVEVVGHVERQLRPVGGVQRQLRNDMKSVFHHGSIYRCVHARMHAYAHPP